MFLIMFKMKKKLGYYELNSKKRGSVDESNNSFNLTFFY